MPGSKRPRDEDDSQPKLQFASSTTLQRTQFGSQYFENWPPESVLKSIWGYDKFRGKQLAAVQQVVQGYSTVVLFPTGAGKSIVFQVAGLIRPGLCIVLCPLIALLSDQVSALEAVGVPVRVWHGKVPRKEKEQTLQDMRAEGGPHFKFLYTTPESLVSGHELGCALGSLQEQGRIGLIAVDEAHCISQDGHDFRPLYRQLSTLQHRFAGVPIAALTATASPSCIADIVGVLGLGSSSYTNTNLSHATSTAAAAGNRVQEAKGYTEVKDAFDRPNLSYGVVYKDVLNAVCPVDVSLNVQPYMRDVLSRVKAVVQGPPPAGLATGSVVIYDLRKQDVVSLTALLKGQGLPVACYHADVSEEEKERVLQGWRAGQIKVVVATTAFGMGIDKPDVRLVLHITMPKSVEGWYQEAGRAGRDGMPAHSLVYYSRADKDFLQRTVSKSIVEERRRRARRQVARDRSEGSASYGVVVGGGGASRARSWLDDAGVEAQDAEQAAVDEAAIDKLLEAEGSELKPWEQSRLTSILTVANICETPACRRTGMLAYFQETLSHGRRSCKAIPLAKHKDWERVGEPTLIVPCDYCAEPAYVSAMSGCLGVGVGLGAGGGYHGGGGINAAAMMQHLQQQGVKVRLGVATPDDSATSDGLDEHGRAAVGRVHGATSGLGASASAVTTTGFITGRQALSAQSRGAAKPSFPSFSGSRHVVAHGSRAGMRDPDLSHLPTEWDRDAEAEEEGDARGDYGGMHLDASDYYEPEEKSTVPARTSASALPGFAPASTLISSNAKGAGSKANSRPGFRPLVPQKTNTPSSATAATPLSTVSLLSMLQKNAGAGGSSGGAGGGRVGGSGAQTAPGINSAHAASTSTALQNSRNGAPSSASSGPHSLAAGGPLPLQPANRLATASTELNPKPAGGLSQNTVHAQPHAPSSKGAAAAGVSQSSRATPNGSQTRLIAPAQATAGKANVKSAAQRLQQGLTAWMQHKQAAGRASSGVGAGEDEVIDVSDDDLL